jgi:general secretion pathway protein C
VNLFKVEAVVIAKIQSALLVALVIYCAFLSAGAIWHYLSPENSAMLVLPKNQAATVKKMATRGDQLSRFHLFGREGQKAVKQEEAPKDAPKTTLRLVLKGVFTSGQGGASGAIVEEIGKSANYYGQGDTLPGNAVLEEVYHDRILLRRNGRLETLAFDDKKTIGKKSRIAKVNAAKPARKRSSGAPVTRVETPEQFIDEATSRLAEDPARALGSVGLKASDSGYVYQGGNPMLSGLNLKKGDVIRSVNGHTLGDIQKDKALMKSLYEQGSIEVEVMRDGASFYINYPLR